MKGMVFYSKNKLFISVEKISRKINPVKKHSNYNSTHTSKICYFF